MSTEAPDRNAALARLIAATTGLESVTHGALFGASALFVGDEPFAVATGEGRIGLRLTDTSLRAALRRRGAIAWTTEAGTLDEWVLVAAADLPHPSELASLVAAAHGMALRAQPVAFAAARPHPRVEGRQTTNSDTPIAKRRTQSPTKTKPAPATASKRTRQS